VFCRLLCEQPKWKPPRCPSVKDKENNYGTTEHYTVMKKEGDTCLLPIRKDHKSSALK
jgi:hypothetical protein